MIDEKYPFHSPLYLMAKPVGAACNLRCSYCYYLEKKDLSDVKESAVMNVRVLERFISDYIEAQTGPLVQFIWHGGEAMMLDIDFYQKVISLQQRYAKGRTIVNSIQTNGTLLTDRWCRFLKDNNWLVGISIDGPKEIHDVYRKDAVGESSFDRVMEGLRMLQRHGVEWNVMATVNNINVKYPELFYDFFKEIGCQYLQFTPIVERHTANGCLAKSNEEGVISPQSVTSEAWGDFLCRVFDRWVRADVGRVFVQLFDATLANWLGVSPGVCSMGKMCGHAGVIEHNGDVYSCDHFVFPEYRLGNIMNRTVVEIMQSEAQRKFSAMKISRLSERCRQCRYLFACNGECPKNRFVPTGDINRPHNYLCEGYFHFFDYSAKYMEFMANEIKAQRPPANVMRLFKNTIE